MKDGTRPINAVLISPDGSNQALSPDHHAPRPHARSIRVLVVAATGLYREALSVALRHVGFEVVGTGEDQSTASTCAAACAPDVVAIDMNMADAPVLLSYLRRQVKGKVVAYGIPDSDAEILACVEAGAHAWVTQFAALAMLVESIERAARDEIVLAPRLAALLVRRLAARAETELALSRKEVTIREQQVLQLVRAGLSNKEIGELLHISEATVKNHVHSILDKYGVRSRRQVMLRSVDELLR